MCEKFPGSRQNGLFEDRNTTTHPTILVGFDTKWTHCWPSRGVLLVREKFLGSPQNGLFGNHNTTKSPSSWGGFKKKWTHYSLSQGGTLYAREVSG